MSYLPPEVIVDRIWVASKKSPIAVFQCAKEGLLDAVFADTIQSRREIKSGRGLIGVYDKSMNLDVILMDLRREVEGKALADR